MEIAAGVATASVHRRVDVKDHDIGKAVEQLAAAATGQLATGMLRSWER